jgi:hypothetical protein
MVDKTVTMVNETLRTLRPCRKRDLSELGLECSLDFFFGGFGDEIPSVVEGRDPAYWSSQTKPSAACSLRRLRASDCVAQRPVAMPEAHDSAFGDDRIHGYVMGLRINCLKTPDFITDANGQWFWARVANVRS